MAPLKALLIVPFLLSSFAFTQELPDAPSQIESKVADRNFWLVTSANAASTVADVLTTNMLVGHTTNCPYEVMSPALYGRKPTAARTSLVMGGLFVASAFTSYQLKKHDVRIWKFKLWSVPQAYLAYGHTRGTIQNLRTCR